MFSTPRLFSSIARSPRITNQQTLILTRFFSASSSRFSSGVVLGIYNDFSFLKESVSKSTLSLDAQQNIVQQLKLEQKKNAPGDCLVTFEQINDSSAHVAVVGLGSKDASSEEKLENIRIAAGSGVKALKARKVDSIKVDSMGNPKAAAEGAFLGAYVFEALKSKQKPQPEISPLDEVKSSDLVYGIDSNDWNIGKMYAEAQNWARNLVNMPANLMTPTIFCNKVKEELSEFPNVQVIVHSAEWVKNHKMDLFMSVAKGSDEPLRFLEIIYKGSPTHDRPVALVGKGVTFDSGGISIKPSRGMDAMKGDMGGAGSVVAAMKGIIEMGLPVYAVACIPLCENLINGYATKPGDVFRAMNGKTVEVLNTDAEGRLILADALTYTVDTYNPTTLIDVATLTGAMSIALGETYSGVFSSSNKLWELLEQSSKSTGDQLWRMPLHKAYSKAMESKVADIANISSGGGGGSCTAAAFLKEFLGTSPKSDEGKPETLPAYDLNSEESDLKWAHIDIAGSMDTTKNNGHFVSGMTGRPTRTLIEFISRFAFKQQ
ncbi:hypothetical protein BB560_003189 [Smittium megazygosporum]|uniref:Cytosol aminopeptidase domain-containing protein n=1 Tax=Smittium megazygosporum TaxID=133381 RepID=A0A2T9ZCT4_9FUNG|nr:hypothetical protein BB560_003189 [Smittium megazygosporum]